MSSSNKLTETLHDVTPTPLIDQQETLLAIPLEKKSYEALQSYLPLNSIDDKQCTLRNIQRLARIIVFFPLLIGILLAFHHNIVSFISQKERNEVNILDWVELVRTEYGNEFYLRNDLPKHMEDARLIGNDKNISFWKYLYYRYNYYHASTRILIEDFFLFGFLLTFTLYLVHRCFLWRLQAPLFIDREKQLFFSWYKGKVYAARYSQVGVSYLAGPAKIVQLMGLAMYTLDGDNALARRAFQMCLSYGSIWGFNTKFRQDEAHTFIVKYLLQGKDAVAATDYKRFPALFLRRDKKPADFDEQLEHILAALDKRDSDNQENKDNCQKSS
ncbi:hypothetical protein [Xenorhabdus bovienii]|uniref:Uncharacterized protein n=1 Tax=Xenorhabdus bovienii str. kraussei Becker Underwood TaxID=1398204 RepID=A0A077PP11_XENBV|nr:hypothetical protein [Xenorhabdus bovienii]CDH22272.1 conserved hypothetical protein [Xenorhabdus bovienii str. kraussei Becker Underwood]